MSWKLSCTVLRGGISGNAGSLLDERCNGKQAFHIHRQDRQLFAFAGLWEQWQHDTETLYSCTIITTAAAELMRPIHDRMPVIITPEHYHQWLDKTADADQAFTLFDNQAYSQMIAAPTAIGLITPGMMTNFVFKLYSYLRKDQLTKVI